MTSSLKKPLDSSEICNIIEACAKSNVTLLKFGDLHVEFGPKAKTVAQVEEPDLQAPHIENKPDTEISEQHKKLNAEAMEEQELLTREMQLEEALITDPVMHEQMLLDGDLEDVDDKPGEHDGDESD